MSLDSSDFLQPRGNRNISEHDSKNEKNGESDCSALFLHELRHDFHEEKDDGIDRQAVNDKR